MFHCGIFLWYFVLISSHTPLASPLSSLSVSSIPVTRILKSLVVHYSLSSCLPSGPQFPYLSLEAPPLFFPGCYQMQDAACSNPSKAEGAPSPLSAAVTNSTMLAQSPRTPATASTKLFHLYGRWGEVRSGVRDVLMPVGSPLLCSITPPPSQPPALPKGRPLARFCSLRLPALVSWSF